VKPAPFGYHAPRDLDAAVDLLARLDGAKVLAGGQSLLPLLSMRLAAPGNLVDINGISELAYVRTAASGVTVGALARHADVLADSAAGQTVPPLAQALRHVAHAAIRNRGTVVGSIVHADPAAELPAVLLLLDGSVEARSARGGVRRVAASELFVGPLETSLRDDEIAVCAHFPAVAQSAGTAFVEVTRRHGDYAVCGVAALVEVASDGAPVRARATYLGIASTPMLIDLTTAIADGDPETAWRRAGEHARDLVHPDADIHASADYRRHLVGVLTARALAAAAADAGREREGAAGTSRPPTSERGNRLVGGAATPTREASASTRRSVTLRVNGVPYDIDVEPRRLLSDALRHDVGLTGTHVGCEHGVCGCCTVLLDGAPMRSCLLLAVSAEGHEVTTVEGCTRPDGSLSPVQQAFRECHGLQCGFCTPGFVTTVTAFLEDNPEPTEADAVGAIGGNLCRCTGYQNIVRSVLRAAELRRGDATAAAAGPR
jgi:CO/xanthine dehydrogenase FAD-binding subunit/aerobic-type carbon monoxide dehydrogenase small subunit (CoxS/CutS family)